MARTNSTGGQHDTEKNRAPCNGNIINYPELRSLTGKVSKTFMNFEKINQPKLNKLLTTISVFTISIDNKQPKL